MMIESGWGTGNGFRFPSTGWMTCSHTHLRKCVSAFLYIYIFIYIHPYSCDANEDDDDVADDDDDTSGSVKHKKFSNESLC